MKLINTLSLAALIGISSCHIINFGNSNSEYYKTTNFYRYKEYILDIKINERTGAAKVEYGRNKNRVVEVIGHFEKVFIKGLNFEDDRIEYVFRYAHHDFNKDGVMDFVEFSPDYYWGGSEKKTYTKESIWMKIKREK